MPMAAIAGTSSTYGRSCRRRRRPRPDRAPPEPDASGSVSVSGSTTVMAQAPPGSRSAVEYLFDGGVGPLGLLLHVGAAADGRAHVLEDLLALHLRPVLAGRHEASLAGGGLGLGLGGLDHRRSGVGRGLDRIQERLAGGDQPVLAVRRLEVLAREHLQELERQLGVL